MIEVIVITGRTTEQGVTIDEKLSDSYMKAVCICEMNRKDMEKIGVKNGDRVLVKNELGEVVLYAKEPEEDLQPPEGIVFIPLGPYANRVVGILNGSGTPQYKGVKATIEKTDREVVPVEEVINL
ncbi:MAG: tRNA CCA-pyrophosphorylase [Archaeoglobus sp.]|jgi:formylmethanofuran dehydrogenase subunit D|nr:MAG: tRNA CCA-pyrophosphorylase [Archaeoglobus sp.]